MSQNLKHFKTANDAYAKDFGDKGKLALPPARRVAILTCMDARLIPSRFLGLEEGDCHVIRNAGGRASDDAIRSLVISTKLLGTNEWLVIHHTDCGMALFTGPIIAELLDESLHTAEVGPDGWRNTHKHGGSCEGHYVNWLTFKNERDSVTEDIKRIRAHPLVPKSIPITGYVYDVRNGRLIEVTEAAAAGAPS
jgi:carbonic anhydrase